MMMRKCENASDWTQTEEGNISEITITPDDPVLSNGIAVECDRTLEK
jgi:hypothetical protein